MAINTDLRPPYPNMGDDELHQFQERLYKAILALEASVTPTPETIDHNDLANNGGDNSHTSIAAHINSDTAHGVSSEIVGINDEQTIINKTIDADNNTISNLKHGGEVDNPTIAHGVSSEIVGVSDTQTIINKVIDANDNAISNLEHGVEVDNPTSAHGSVGALVGENNTQTLKNKGLDGLHNSVTNMRHGIEVDNESVGVHGALGSVVGTAGEQILFDKIYLQRFREIVSDDYALPNDCYLKITALATLTLYPITVYTAGFYLRIDNAHTAGITVDTDDTATIQGETSQTVPPNSCMVIVSDGTNWRIV